MTASTPSPDGAGNSHLVRVSGVRKAYRMGDRVVEALRGVDLAIVEPGFYAIMGASGSGKSTLLHLLAGLDRPDAGSLHVAGWTLESLSERQLTEYRRHRIGIIFQQFNLIPTLSAIDNVILPGLLGGRSRGELVDQGQSLLHSLGLKDRSNHRPDALSGGEQQRVAIARALLYSPSVLFADEPTGNLDSGSSEQLWRVLRQLAEERGVTVVMVTHEPTAAIHCRRVHVLRDGRFQGSFDVNGADATELAARYQQLGGAPR